MVSNQDIILYTHKGCPGGDRAILYFHENDIPVQIKDIVNDLDALNEFREHGCIATPVLMIDGRKFVGFDEDEVQQVLGKSRTT